MNFPDAIDIHETNVHVSRASKPDVIWAKENSDQGFTNIHDYAKFIEESIVFLTTDFSEEDMAAVDWIPISSETLELFLNVEKEENHLAPVSYSLSVQFLS